MGWDYSEKTKQLFLDAVHGKPGTHLGEIENPDGLGEHGSIACGDALRFTFRVEKNEDPLKDVIVEARYLAFGCTSAIAASEALCCIIEGQKTTPIEALKITNADIVEFLEGLPQQKIHCSVMGAEALEAAVRDWAKKRGVDLAALGIVAHAEAEDEGRIVCKCFGVTEPYIRRKVKELNLRTIADITNAIKAGGACASCHHSPGGLQDILDDIWGKDAVSNPQESPIGQDTPPTAPVPPFTPTKPSGNFVPLEVLGSKPNAEPDLSALTPGELKAGDEDLSPYQLAKKIEKTIEFFISPLLQKDGGDIEIVDIKGELVFVKLTGACADCGSANQTLKILVENTLKNQVSQKIRVIQV